MSIIKTLDLIHDFLIRDESDQVAQVTRSLDGVSLEIEKGSFVAILGHNGSGKSTLARHLNALLAPTSGTVWVRGRDTSDPVNYQEIRKSAGMVFQNPDNQIIASVVEEDVAFGPENLGLPSETIWERVQRCLGEVGMTAYKEHSPNRLSGGQKQRVAIAGIMAMQPECMILDEATAMLDPKGRREVMEAIHKLNREEGVTILHITHDVEEAVDADRIIVMEKGRVVMDGTPAEIFAQAEQLVALRLEVPEITRLALALKKSGMPVDTAALTEEALITEIRAALEASNDGHVGSAFPGNAVGSDGHAGRTFTGNAPDVTKAAQITDEFSELTGKMSVASAAQETLQGASAVRETMQAASAAPELIRFDNVSFTYSGSPTDAAKALKEVSLTIRQGSYVGLIGQTGSGKSTFLQHINGLIHPTEGTVLYRGEDIAAKGYDRKALFGRAGLIFQYPEHQLFEETVIRDVMFGPKNLGLSDEEARARAEKALLRTGLTKAHFEKSPFELSGGEKRRVAIAGVLAMQPELLILDEPTAGLDPAGRRELFEMIRQIHEEEGVTIILSSHYMEDMAQYADRLIVMHDGRVEMDGSPEEVYGRRDRLTEIGLAAPRMAYFKDRMAEAGIAVASPCLTVEMTAQALMALYHGGKASAEQADAGNGTAEREAAENGTAEREAAENGAAGREAAKNEAAGNKAAENEAARNNAAGNEASREMRRDDHA